MAQKQKLPEHLKNAKKAYDNSKFLHSRDGRVVRILSEYLYPEQHLKKHGINKTIIFFGSARVKSLEYVHNEIKRLKDAFQNNTIEETKYQNELKLWEKKLKTSSYYEDALKLSKMLADWSMKLPKSERFHIASGGGPGIMEASNRGAYESGMESPGFNISLPFEQEPNRYITPSLNFEFHYFFMRKFWLVYLSQCMVIFPGGFGTIDEMMEVLTLRQTNKMKRPRLIVLFDEKYWKNIINFDVLVEEGMIHQEDVNLLNFVNTPEEAFKFITSELNKNLVNRI